MSNQPIINNRDKNLSASVFVKTYKDKDGNDKDFNAICLQRSYKKKDANEWTREQINLTQEELLKLSCLTLKTYYDILGVNKSIPDNLIPVDSAKVEEVSGESIDDSIPF